ncbi:SLC15A1 family protein [Megaselia abdita]
MGAEDEKTSKGLEDSNKQLESTAKDIDTAEGQVEKLKYPKSVFFIISNEFCERFNYYGMRTILVLYLSRELNFSDDDATVIFHVFTMCVYFLCLFGAIISDSWLGKFRTIFYLSIVYVIGSIILTLGSVPQLNLPGITFTMIGLALTALGSGGIKPCVSAFGGDQFKMPEQIKQMTTFFSIFYFAINSGSFISTTVTPILREDVHCFGEEQCYPLAFGLPAVLMIVSIFIFVAGKSLYHIKPPAGNMLVTVSKCVGCAISNKWKTKKTNPREHWLDYAEVKYDRQTIADIKVLFRVLLLYVPLPLFWALFDQQGSRWTLQATRMSGDMGSWDIKPDQVQMLNPLLILAFIPLYEAVFYPLLSKIGIRRPLQKLTLGGIFAGIAFILSAVVELQLEKSYPVLPKVGSTQLRIFNGIPDCEYHIKIPELQDDEIILNGISYFEQKFIQSQDKSYEFSITSNDAACPGLEDSWKLEEFLAFSVYLKRSDPTTLVADIYEDDVTKPSRGSPMFRLLCNEQPPKEVILKKGSIEKFNNASNNNDLFEVPFGTYDILFDGQKVDGDIYLGQGGVYTYIMEKDSTNTWKTKLIEITQANTVNILWLIPQYVVMTLGEVMFSVTGLEFSYSQAPASMKSVIQACFQLTVAFGNVIVVIIAEANIFDSQANEFFLFAGLMFVDMIAFAILAYFYKPNNPNKSVDEDSEVTEEIQDNFEKPSAIEYKAAETEASPSAPTEITKESEGNDNSESKDVTPQPDYDEVDVSSSNADKNVDSKKLD